MPWQCCESFFFVHGTEKRCNGACKGRSVYRAALERGKKQPIKYKKETLVCGFLQGKVHESNTRKKVRKVNK